MTNKSGCGISVGIIILGVKSFTPDGLQFTISPNPVSDELMINGNGKFENGILSIYNTLGEKVYIKEMNSKQEVVNCKSFPAGIYLVNIQNDKQKWEGRFVKE